MLKDVLYIFSEQGPSDFTDRYTYALWHPIFLTFITVPLPHKRTSQIYLQTLQIQYVQVLLFNKNHGTI